MRGNRRHTLRDSFADALVGLRTAFYEERNMRIHSVCTVIVVTLGVWFGLDNIEWALILMAIALVISAELMNSAVERAVDLAEPNESSLAALSKQLAASAVLVVAVVAVLIGSLVFVPHIMPYLR